MAKTSIPSDSPIASSAPYAVHSRSHGTEGYDVATPIQTAPLNGPDINIWARYKPVVPITDHPGDLTDAERRAVNYGLALYYDGTNYTPSIPAGGGSTLDPALSFTKYTAITEIPKCLWKYDRRPGASDWKRLTDWVGYEVNAAPPISPVGDFILYNSDNTLTIRGGVTGIHTQQNIELADFPYLSDLFFAIIIYRERLSSGDVEVCGYATAPYAIGSGQVGAFDITINRSELQFANASSYSSPRYILCAATSAKTSLSATEQSVAFCPLPTNVPLTGTITLSSASTFIGKAYAINSRDNKVGLDVNRFLPKNNGNEHFGISDGLWVFCEFTSSNATAQNIPLSALTVRVSKTLSSDGSFANPITIQPAGVYTQTAKGSAYTLVNNTLTIPASGTLYAILDLSNMTTLGPSGVPTDPSSRFGTFVGSIGRIGSSISSFTGAIALHINIHTANGVITTDDDFDALPAI